MSRPPRGTSTLRFTLVIGPTTTASAWAMRASRDQWATCDGWAWAVSAARKPRKVSSVYQNCMGVPPTPLTRSPAGPACETFVPGETRMAAPDSAWLPLILRIILQLLDLGHDRPEQGGELHSLASVDPLGDHRPRKDDHRGIRVLEAQHPLPLPLDCDPLERRSGCEDLAEHDADTLQLFLLASLEYVVVLQPLEQSQVVLGVAQLH